MGSHNNLYHSITDEVAKIETKIFVFQNVVDGRIVGGDTTNFKDCVRLTDIT